VVSVLGCCTAAPGSIPARHPSLDPAGRKLFAQMQGVIYPAQEERIPSRRTSRGRIMYVSYRNRNYKINKKSAGHGTNIKKILYKLQKSRKPYFSLRLGFNDNKTISDCCPFKA
jgi:hypothetical protein